MAEEDVRPTEETAEKSLSDKVAGGLSTVYNGATHAATTGAKVVKGVGVGTYHLATEPVKTGHEFGLDAGNAMENTPIGKALRSGPGGLVTSIITNPWVQTGITIFAAIKGLTSLANGSWLPGATLLGVAYLAGTGGMEKFFNGLMRGAELGHQGSGKVANFTAADHVNHEGAAYDNSDRKFSLTTPALATPSP